MSDKVLNNIVMLLVWSAIFSVFYAIHIGYTKETISYSLVTGFFFDMLFDIYGVLVEINEKLKDK